MGRVVDFLKDQNKQGTDLKQTAQEKLNAAQYLFDNGKKGGGSSGGVKEPAVNPYASQMSAAQKKLKTPQPTFTDTYAGRINQLEANAPGAYTSKYQPNIDLMLDKLQNREELRYNMSEDPLYRQLAARHMMQGKQAMQDAVGTAAGMTGGYGNSYAATAGNQAYQQHINALNDEAVNLYALARQGYDQETADMHSALGQLQTAENMQRGMYESDRADYYNRLAALREGQATEYGRQMDQVGLWSDDQQRAWEQYKYWNDLYESKK